MANPAIVLANGSLTVTTTETNLFELIADKYARCYINLKNMASGDTFRVRIYVWDENLGEYMKVEQTDYSNAQDPVGKRLPFEACSKYKVTIQKTAGVDRIVSWLRIQV